MTKVYKLGRMYLVRGNDYVPELKLSSNNLYQGINEKVGRFLYRESNSSANIKEHQAKKEELRSKCQSLSISITPEVEAQLGIIALEYNQVMWVNETHIDIINLLVSTYGIEELYLEALNTIRDTVDNAMDYEEEDMFQVWESLTTHDKEVFSLLGIHRFNTFWSSDCSVKMMAIFNWPLNVGKTCSEEDVNFYNISLDEIWNGEELITQEA